jgi:hypothetical protein
MCIPLVIAATALSAAASVAQQQAQSAAQTKTAKQAAAAANQSAVNQYAQNNLRIQQEGEAAATDMQKTQVKALQAQGTARAAANEAGVSGISVDSLLADFTRQQDNYDSALHTNVDNTAAQIMESDKGIRSDAQNRINTAFSNIKQPDFLGAAFRIGTDTLDYYTPEKPKN